MSELINIYCDESCHLFNETITDDNRFMVIGGISCPNNKKREVFDRIKSIKKDNNLTALTEVKWTKTSIGKINAYRDLIHYFFDNHDLSFRAVIIDKKLLEHHKFNHTHDMFYYKTYWLMLDRIIDPENKYHIYMDIKDTQGTLKINQLQKVLCNHHHDFDKNVIKRIQHIRSHEVGLNQIVDLLIGAISYGNRYPNGGKSKAKNNLIDLIKERSKLSLLRTTALGAKKVNLLKWQGNIHDIT